MLFKMIMDAVRTAIARAVEKTTSDAVEAGVAKGIQTGLTRSFGDFKLPDDVQSQIDKRVASVPALLTEEKREALAIEASVEDAKTAKPAAKRRKK